MSDGAESFAFKVDGTNMGDLVFYGLVIVKGEVELKGSDVYGSIVTGTTLHVKEGARVRYSGCAADRALASLNLTGYSTLGGSWTELSR